MNLNELNKIEESIVSSIKGMFTGQGGFQTKVQDIFIKDFVQDAITSLNNGVKGGLIDANVKSTPASATAASNAAPAAAASNAAPAGDDEPAGQQFMGKIAPDYVRPATKPPAPASPFATPTLNQPKTTVSATGAPSKPGSITSGGPGIKVKESTYDKMNRIFESIVNIDEQAELRTISDYMMDWFGQYMQGVNWQASQAIVKQKLDKLQDEYPKNIDANLKDLARVGLALSKAGPGAGTPAGAPQEFTQARKQAEGSIEELKAALDELAKSDPNGYNELIKTLKPVAAT
jgi:hypothetical protein